MSGYHSGGMLVLNYGWYFIEKPFSLSQRSTRFWMARCATKAQIISIRARTGVITRNSIARPVMTPSIHHPLTPEQRIHLREDLALVEERLQNIQRLLNELADDVSAQNPIHSISAEKIRVMRFWMGATNGAPVNR
jgi:hypothetical protein